ncbi:MAG: hypothetical protein IPJ31_08905 [Bacteroidetes bacterium]|nr:hypothetical protein [Bacteroidota bacterium]
MDHFELTPRESAYNAAGYIIKNIDQLRKGSIPNKDYKAEVDEFENRVSHIDPAITLPVVQGILESIDTILASPEKLSDQIVQNIDSTLIMASKLFQGSENLNECAKPDVISIQNDLIKELNFYRASLGDLEERLEVLNIDAAAKATMKLKWDLPLERVADLFKVLREMECIKEEKDGDLVSFFMPISQSKRAQIKVAGLM